MTATLFITILYELIYITGVEKMSLCFIGIHKWGKWTEAWCIANSRLVIVIAQRRACKCCGLAELRGREDE